MGNNLTTFNFGENQVRTFTIDGEPWFVGKDICDILGYSDPTTAIRSHCRGVQRLHPILDRLGRSQEIRIISEPDMMRLIIGSKLPAAQKFESWVFDEVLPAIRKTGTYSDKPAPAQSPVFLTMPPVMEALQVSNMLADALNLYGTSRTAMINAALKIKAPEYLSLMPAYATNAPRTMSGKLLGGEGNSLPAFAATSLLKKFNSGMPTVIFNKLAEAHGYLETRERPSSRHENVAKTYKAITTKGLEFGYNLSNEFSKGSVSPVWFESKFPELLDIICY